MPRESEDVKVSITVNGQSTTNTVEARTLLVHYLREVLGLTGTNIGCDTTSCGACTVLLDGESVKSCTVLAAQAGGSLARAGARSAERTGRTDRARRQSLPLHRLPQHREGGHRGFRSHERGSVAMIPAKFAYARADSVEEAIAL